MDNAVRLRWTSHQGTVLSVFDALLASESLVDVTLAADGQYIRAHKIILSACSPYFQDLLSLDNNKSPIIFLKDVKFYELKALVQFIYRGEVNIGQDQLLSFLAVAQSLKIRGLASVDVSNNGVGSDTLIIPEFNNSLNTNESVNPSAPVPLITGRTVGNEYQTNQPQVSHSQVFQRTPRPHVTNSAHQTVQVHVDQAQNSIPPNSDLRNRTVLPPTLPPPSKRLRTIQQDPLDLEAVSITEHSQSQHMYDPLSEKPSTSTSGDGHAHVDNQNQCGMQAEMNDHEQGEHMFHAEDVDVKLDIGIGEGMETNLSVGLGLYDESENGDTSISQSDFTNSMNQDEIHPFQNVATVMMDGSTEELPMPSGSGTSRSNKRRTAISTARAGTATVDEVAEGHTHTEDGDGSHSDFKCHTCGKTYSSKGNLIRHRRYECTINIRPFACSWCDYRTSFKYNLKRHQEVCARKPSSS